LKKTLYIFFLVVLGLSVFAGNSDKEKSNTKIIAGKITDNNGESLSGARITVDETGEVVFADLDGNFKLTVKTDKEYSISVSTIGYRPLTLKSTFLGAFSNLALPEL
jgi:hypothetical protein